MYIKIGFSSLEYWTTRLVDNIRKHSEEETILIIVLARKRETIGIECQIWPKTLYGDSTYKA
jgi:hypothetical protein